VKKLFGLITLEKLIGKRRKRIRKNLICGGNKEEKLLNGAILKLKHD